MITVFGLRNCDSCRKALRWLAAQGIAHRFHDVRADGLDAAALDAWIAALGWEALLNRRGTTWRRLPEEARAGLTADRARDLMLDNPTLIKRPVIAQDGRVLVGFSEATKQALRR